MKPVPLAIRLFGALDVSVAGEPLGPVRTHSVEWLLVLLALRSGRPHPLRPMAGVGTPVSRSWLAGTLWPESSGEQALYNLRRNLLELRRAMGVEADRLGSPTRDTLCLDLTGADVDVVAFDAAIAAGDEPSLQRAVGLYRGPLLEGCIEEWILAERERRAEACLQALESLADRAAERGEHGEALGYLRQAEAIDALRDGTQRRLMQVLAAGGNAAAAILTYREYRLRLHREMMVEPDPETTQLFQELRAASRRTTLRRPGPPVPPTPPSPDPAVLRASAGATRALPPPGPSPLPRPLTALIGREEAVRQLVDFLTGSRLVTLVGGGGVGKTRLALQVAEAFALAEDVVFVELAPVADPALVPASVAKAVGVPEETESDSLSVVQSLVARLSIRPALLVLDNCEHLVEAVAPLAGRLLEACPPLRVVATSRQRLGLTGEIVWRVPSLPAPDPQRVPAAEESAREYALRYPAVQLFVERAGAIRPGYERIGRAEALAVTQICRRLDGIPLAIELAAARVETLTAGQIAARLDDRFRLLMGGSRAALPRQRTLQALIDWSYDLLPDAERALLRRLSVFAGGWTLEAAEAVAAEDEPTNDQRRTADEGSDVGYGSWVMGRDEVLDLLTGLVEKSLVVYEEHGDAEVTGDALWEPVVGRYQMLETVREYAREKLRESGEEAVARRRHAEFFLRVAEQARGAEAGPREEEALAHLERERDNLRAALAWSQSTAADLELGLQLGVALGWFWKTRGYLAEGRGHLARLLEADAGRPTGVTRARAWAFAVAGDLALLQGDSQSARPLLENSLSLARATGDRALIASALSKVGYLERDPRVSRALYEESLAIYRELGDRHHVAALLASLGMTYSGSDLVRARSLYEEALAVFRQLDSKSSIAWTLVHLYNLTSSQGDYAAARGHAEESLALFRALGHRMGIGCSLNQLGRVAFHEGDLDDARSLYEQGLQIARELGSQQDIATTLSTLADVALAQEAPASAAAYYEQALKIFRETNDWTNSWLTRIGLGRLAEQQGDEARAKAVFQESLAIGQKQDQAVIIVVSLEALGRVAAQKGDALGARLLAAAAAHREKIGTPVPPVERPALERALAAVRAEMGEPAFTAAWAEGSSLTLEQAAAEALGRISPHGG